MRNIRKLLVLVVMLVVGVLLVACGGEKKKNPTAEVDSLKITRTSFTLEFTITDEDEVLNYGTLEGKLTYKDKEHINTYQVTKVEDKEKTYKIIGTNLSINHEYTIRVTGVANKKVLTLVDETFRTKHEGSSSENPIYIETVEQFMNLDDDYSAYYKLVNDLDFSEVEDFTPLFLSRAFTGSFDGDGKTLSNLTINERHTYVAIFGRNSGTVKNLNIDNMNISLIGSAQSSQYISLVAARNTGTVENVTITNSKISTHFQHSGLVRIGGISAYSESGSKINNSTVDVTFDIKSLSRTEYNIGGLAGQLNGASMVGNKVKLSIEINNSTTAYIGGAIGLMDSSSLNDPSARETEAELDININTKVERVVANDRAVAISIGGFVGKASSAKITDAYAKANIVYPTVHNVASGQSSSDKVALGGFAGSVSNRSEMRNILADSNISLGSVYEPTEFNVVDVKFELGYDNERLEPVETRKGEPVAAPEDPVREGYNFLGWYLGDNLYDFSTPVNNSINLVAQWENIDPEATDLLVVIFDRGYSGLYYKTTNVIKGERVNMPEDPLRDGHRFLGWFIDGVEFDSTQPINHSIAVQAKWVKIGIDRIELIYLGGVAGESFSSTHEKNYARNPNITLHTDEGKYVVDPVVAAEDSDESLGSYSGSTILIDEVNYDNEHYQLVVDIIETIPLTPTELEGYFDSVYILDILNR